MKPSGRTVLKGFGDEAFAVIKASDVPVGKR
jgi:molybdopterin-binding protein